MSQPMKGITCCADCAYYNMKKHHCTRASDEGKPTDHFYADCPLPDATVIQGPRVLTLDELDAIFNEQQNHVWPYNSPPYLWMTVNPEIRRTNGFWICWRDIVSCLTYESQFYTRDNYNKSWKIWFKEPTDEQRNAAPWT